MKKNDCKIKANLLVCNGRIFITANENIQDYIITNDCVIILVVPNESGDNQNVYCYELNGNLRWKIDPTYLIHDSNYYSSIYLSKIDLLQAYNINGIEVTIDISNGHIINNELIK